MTDKNQNEKESRLIELGEQVLIISRNTLLVKLRFLDMALSQFHFVPVSESTLLTDGQRIFFNPRHVLLTYKNEREAPTRDYLHMVFHCIFRHMYMDPTLNRSYWDLACDIAVENVISELGLKSVASQREQRQKEYLQALRKKQKILTAEKIYHYLLETEADPRKTETLRTLFCADDHQLWYMTDDQIAEKFQQPQSDNQRNSDDQESSDGRGKSEDKKAQTGEKISRQEMQTIWTDISQRMQTDLETFAKQQGDLAGGLTQNLQAVNREKYDYTAFLKKFAVMGETMKINDDEFDYIFYTYGLQLYKKMPLIEPLEYKEVKRIKEFVIAIDTSGSTSGELVQKFIQKTYNILKSTESFFSKINLHIIQCDAELQEDAKITCQEEFDDYLQHMQIRGMGGTDFRPVFSYVEQLRQQKEFVNLKGLIYFTDGFGEFPARKPDYDTAFVYVDDDYNNPDVPPWAIKLVLQTDEV